MIPGGEGSEIQPQPRKSDVVIHFLHGVGCASARAACVRGCTRLDRCKETPRFLQRGTWLSRLCAFAPPSLACQACLRGLCQGATLPGCPGTAGCPQAPAVLRFQTLPWELGTQPHPILEAFIAPLRETARKRHSGALC